ncbi:MAG: hypothetical protein KF789_14550 [Bdellovibrionaceae bacterium]|nr:hypothetical protein [Pseudobdellovibrionaceae bacterium]
MTTSNTNPENVAGETSSGNLRNILIVGTDLGFAKSVQSIVQGLKGSDVSFRIFPGVDLEKITDCISKHPLHSILVDEDFLTDRTPEQFIATLREICKKSPHNAQTPCVFVTAKTTLETTKKWVRVGWKDVLLKPLDSTLFLQKMNIYNPALSFLKEALLFTMEVGKEIDLAFQFKTKSISEYGLKIESSRDLELGAVVGVSGVFLTEPLSAVVLESKKISDGVFAVQLMFIGITPAETQSIRKLIRQEYAEEKQAA